MTKKELIKLNFNKIDVLNEDSQNGFDYYLYELKITDGLILSSSDSSDTKNNKWKVINYDWPEIKNINKKSILNLINLNKK